ncbi:MAG: hypothetical protein AB8G17_09620 [Gammaproteobacteria bacterium]
MTEKPNEPRVEILLKNRGPAGNARVGAMPSGDGSGRWFAFGALALLYIVMLVVFTDSFAPRVEWTDSAGRVLLEDRPVFWPLLLFAVIGRLAVGMAVWYPRVFDPTKGFFPIQETPALRRRRTVFRVLYGLGLGLAVWTLLNNLALADIYDVLQAVATAVAIIVGVALLFRVALMSVLNRMASNLRPPPR